MNPGMKMKVIKRGKRKRCPNENLRAKEWLLIVRSRHLPRGKRPSMCKPISARWIRQMMFLVGGLYQLYLFILINTSSHQNGGTFHIFQM